VWYWPPTPSSAEVKERVALYLYSHSVPSWPVLGWTLPLPLPLLEDEFLPNDTALHRTRLAFSAPGSRSTHLLDLVDCAFYRVPECRWFIE